MPITTLSPIVFLIDSILIAPSLKIDNLPFVYEITVLGAVFDPHGELIEKSILSPNCRSTSVALVIGGSPVRLQLVPVIGVPQNLINCRARLWSGTLRPTVPVPAVTEVGTSSDDGSTMVSAPGQNLDARSAATSGNTVVNSVAIFKSLKSNGTGVPGFLPFTSKTCSTALLFKPSAPRAK